MKLSDIIIKKCNARGYKLVSDLLSTNCFFEINKVYYDSAVEYAKLKCKEQRQLCSEQPQQGEDFKLNIESIINSPEPNSD
jgi:hypothetical protein